MEVYDDTMKCVAFVDHQILLAAVGKLLVLGIAQYCPLVSYCPTQMYVCTERAGLILCSNIDITTCTLHVDLLCCAVHKPVASTLL